DAVQVVSSSMCKTTLEVTEDGPLLASVTMPCVECAARAGSVYVIQSSHCLQLLGVAGPSAPASALGKNTNTLAEIITATVLAGELSLMAALCTDDLVKSHQKLNR
ncbi:hypothetical protein PENTCL1PPCAC_15154, partial [Pristionchus entomophagus]